MVVRVISNAFLYILQREAQSCSVLDYVLVYKYNKKVNNLLFYHFGRGRHNRKKLLTYLNVIVVIIDICLFPLPLASSIL
jgi:hypothetical protein